MRAKTIINQVNKFNKELNEYYTTTGENELYEVDTTIEGDSLPLDPAIYIELKNEIVVELDDSTFSIPLDSDSFALDELKEMLQYERRRLRKSWRVWKSENPDAELEKEDEE